MISNSVILFWLSIDWSPKSSGKIAVAIITIGVLSALYTGYLNPEFRSAASNLSAIINGVATMLMFIFIDPFLSVMTDDVVLDKTNESLFRKYIVYKVFARLLGTVLAQFIFKPSAQIIAWIADMIWPNSMLKKKYMSFAVSVLTTRQVSRNNGVGAWQESNPQSATAYSFDRCQNMVM